LGAYIALACVCFFWGTTYLGIRVGLESFTPAMLMFLRYMISGGVLLLGAWLKGAEFPKREEAWKTAMFGIVTIGFGTGSLAYAEQWVPSGLAALLVSTQPFWLTGLEAISKGGERLHAPAVRGMLVGLAGVVFLIVPSLSHITAGDPAARTLVVRTVMTPRDLVVGFLILQFGAAMWSIGSIGQRKLATRAHPFVSGGVQQLATGLIFAVPAFWPYFNPVANNAHTLTWTETGMAAIVYLAIFGGIVGYSAYIFTLDRLPVALVSIYTYINPLVAVILGYLFYREAFGWREAVAMMIIFIGVAMVKWASGVKSLRRGAG
jgi:drug/metabolite transporter (DMT)-like permease